MPVASLRLAPLLLLAVLSLACAGDDSGDSATTTTDAASTSAAASTSTTTGAPTTTSESSSTADPTSTTSATTTASATDPTTTSTSDPTTSSTTDPTTSSTTDPSTTGVEPSGCTPEATELIALVNAYRVDKGLPQIPASSSLCAVGQAHVVDLHEQAPHEQPGCNLHSWSGAGAWSPCCYTNDHAQAMCMWIKPQELTNYPGYGYENAAFGAPTPASALSLWQSSGPHNDVILNQGIWADFPWKAVGAGLHEGYAVLWFGAEPDPG